MSFTPTSCYSRTGYPVSTKPFLPLGWTADRQVLRQDGTWIMVDGFIGNGGSARPLPVNDKKEEQLRRLLQLYEKGGLEFLRQLRGSFCLALWDAQASRLLLAVDHFGTRPMYYWSGGGMLVFAPRISCFSYRHEIPRAIDVNALFFYLNHSFIPAPFTIYKDIKRLEPGQVLIWEKGRVVVQWHWDMNYDEDEGIREMDAAATVRSAVEESLRFLLRNESHTNDQRGAFLSGGTDSSTVVGLMSEITGVRTNSFSVGFAEEQYNEIDYARIAAKHFNSQAHEHFVRAPEALEAMSLIAQQYDEPFGNSSAIPTFVCLKMARDAGIEVMFAGDGGDELFAGNERYITEKVFSLYHRIPPRLRKVTNFAAKVFPSVYPWRKFRNYVYKANQPAIDRFFAYQLYIRDHAGEFLTFDFRDMLNFDFPLEIPRRQYERMGNASPLNRLLYVDLKLAIADNDLFKVNRMAECQGIQVRYPYLDPIVAAVSSKIVTALKLKGWQKRYIFKKAFADLLPREILQKKKHGFGLPTGHWLRTDPGFRELARSLLLEPRSLQRGYFNRAALEKLLRMHDEERSAYYGTHIWNFMMLELWHRNFVDER